MLVHKVFYTDRFIPKFAAGCARGPFIFIRPSYRHDLGLLEHEKVHVKQFWRTLGFHGLLYVVSPSYRFNAECEAYAVQTRYGLRILSAANFVVDHYDLARHYTTGGAIARIQKYVRGAR